MLICPRELICPRRHRKIVCEKFSLEFHITIAIQKYLGSHPPLQDHRSKGHRSKDRRSKDRRSKDHRSKERRSKDHRSKTTGTKTTKEIEAMPMQEGDEFVSFKAFKAAMQDWAMAGVQKFNLRYKKSDSSRNVVVCAHDDCPFRISATFSSTRQCVVVVSIGEEHNCVGAGQISHSPSSQQTWLQRILPAALPSTSLQLLGQLLMLLSFITMLQ